MGRELLPEVPTEVPQKFSSLSRLFGRLVLKLLRWKVSGEFPRYSKAIVIVAPHTSNWDFITAMAAVMAVGVKVNFLMKKEAFIWPFSVWFKRLGGVPLDRSDSANTVDQIAEHFLKQDKLWVAIAPEGTRKKVNVWKTGFARVAKKAEVPVVLVAWNYPTKEIILDRHWVIEDDYTSQVAHIQNYVNAKFIGKHPHQQ